MQEKQNPNQKQLKTTDTKNTDNGKTLQRIKESKTAKKARLAVLKKNKDLKKKPFSKGDFLKQSNTSTVETKNVDPLLSIYPSDEDLVSTASETDASSSSPKKILILLFFCFFFMASFVSWNCRSIKNKFSDLKDIINLHQPSVIALQETYLKPGDTLPQKNFNILLKNGTGDRATGGVALLTSNSFPTSPITLNTPLQAIAVQIHTHSLITVCSLYLPPNTPVDQITLNNLVSQLPTPFIILGDMNGHSPLWGNPDTNTRGLQVEKILNDHNLCLLNNDEYTYFHEPTRTFHSVDLAICTPSVLPYFSLQVDNDLHNSDHFPLIISDNRRQNLSIHSASRYNFKLGNWCKFSSLANINKDIVSNSSIDAAVKNVTEVLIAAADRSIPKNSNTFKKQRKVWWNADCREAHKKQRKAWALSRRNPTTVNLIRYKQTKANSRRIQRRSKRESWERYISSINSKISSKKLWERVKKTSGIFKSSNIRMLYNNGIPVTSLQDIANCIASELSRTSNSSNYSVPFLNFKISAEKKNLNFHSSPYAPYNTDFTFSELKRCLSETHKTSPGPDNISYLMLQHLSDTSLQNLLFLYNRIWQEHSFPSCWQQAIIIPILKPGKEPLDPRNYRPITLTSCLCKILEKMVNKRLLYYLEINKIFSPFQSGFRQGRCTVDNLLALETEIRNAFIRRHHTVAIVFDIEKAYDRSWRFGILRDLYECNLRGNLPIFIQNFLKLRKFRVQIGNQLSDYFIQEEGVPQGSVLSVTLFALKINDILKQLPPYVKGFLYVDDLYISCTGDNINFIERQLQLAVNKIQQWSTLNGFTLSTAKTSCIHFCRKRCLHPEPEILLGSQLITVVNEVKFLGLTFDKKLTFRPHVIKLRKKFDKALNILKVLSNTSWGASRTSLLRVYRAAILSKMDCGCVIYGSARQSVLKILDPIHHSALRLCSGGFRTSPVESLYVECCEPPLDHRRKNAWLFIFIINFITL
ncbi:RNA-directed DNA polymerase from mobile element jockey [Araneus ventricosus]|uniref:RNA-directed DNA polymerase from mobile element jockey n=1 Tax=Araneus ventricosus TaxID=182803 RepID=A0A4Y2SLZ0_ARAVE|nr:RNA-directed DNA polymerase from mobile element jockey [Araneus ventricosus]